MKTLFKELTNQKLKDVIKSHIDFFTDDWERVVDVKYTSVDYDSNITYVTVIKVSNNHIAIKNSFVYYEYEDKLEFLSCDGVL